MPLTCSKMATCCFFLSRDSRLTPFLFSFLAGGYIRFTVGRYVNKCRSRFCSKLLVTHPHAALLLCCVVLCLILFSFFVVLLSGRSIVEPNGTEPFSDHGRQVLVDSEGRAVGALGVRQHPKVPAVPAHGER